MAHFAYPAGTPTGVVPYGYVVPSTDWAYVVGKLFKAVNGDDGGTWAPGAFLTIGGSGLQLTGTAHELAASAKLSLQTLSQISIEAGAAVRANGTGGADILLKVSAGGVASLQVLSGAVITVEAGGAVDVSGGLTLKTGGPGAFTAEDGTLSTWASGSLITWALGSTASLRGAVDVYTTLFKIKSGAYVTWLNGSFLQSEASATGLWLGTWSQVGAWTAVGATVTVDGTSTLACASGSTVTLAGTTTFTNSKWPKLSPDRTWTRHSLTIAMTTYGNASAVIPDEPDIWVIKSDLSSTPALKTRSSTVSGPKSLIEFTNLPVGGTLVSMTVKSNGTSTTAPTFPTYRIVRWVDGEDGYENMSDATVDAHGGTGDWGTSVQETELTVNDHAVIDGAYRYGLTMTHPYNSPTTSAMFVYDVRAEGTTDVLRV